MADNDSGELKPAGRADTATWVCDPGQEGHAADVAAVVSDLQSETGAFVPEHDQPGGAASGPSAALRADFVKEEIAAVIREAVNDAYRLGFGAAVQAVEVVAVHSMHPAMYHDLIARLRLKLLELAKEGS